MRILVTKIIKRYVAQQKEAFLKGIPPPDFPGGLGESGYADRATAEDIQCEAGRVAMGLSPVRLQDKSEKSRKLEEEVNKILGF